MKAFLISLGLVLVTALTVALVGPNFIDWNGYRTLIEAEAGRLVGHPVKIGGDLRVRALPRPRLRANDVHYFASEGGAAIVSAQSVEIHLDLGALILGDIEISELTLVAPELQVAPLLEGIAGLGEREQARVRPGVLRRIEARNATLVFDHPFDQGTLSASDVDLQITATTLTGPFKVTGSYGPRGEGLVRPTFTSSVGAIDLGGQVKIAGRIGLDVGEASFDGVLDDLALAPRYEGRLKLEREFASAEEGVPGRLTLEASAELVSGLADLNEVKLTAADGAQALAFTGTGRANFVGAPRFSADLKARQVDLDATLGASEDDALAREIRDMAASLARFAGENELAGRLQLAIDGAIWRSELARDISAAVEISPGVVGITNLQGSLPGKTNVSLSGQINLAEAPRFEGHLVAETLEAGRLVRWVAPESGAGLGDILGRSRGKFSINGAFSADEQALTLDAVDGFADGNPFSGSFSVALGGERSRIRTDLSFDLIALDRYLPAEAKPTDLLLLLTGPQLTEPTDSELVVDARAKRVAWRGREARGVEVGLISADGGIDIVGVNVGRFAGATISVEGHVQPSPKGPLGAVQVGLEAHDLSTLLAVLEVDTPSFMGVAPSLREVDLVVSIDSELSTQGRVAVLSASGEVAGASVEINATSDAPLAEFADGALKLAANIEASEAGRIIGPGGLLPLAGQQRPGGAGRVNITGEGRLSDKLELAILAEAFGGVLKGQGNIEGSGAARANISLGANRFGPIAEAFGLAIPDTIAAAPIRMDAQLSGTADRIEIEVEDGVVAGARVAGTAAISGTAPRRIDLDFETSRLSLPWVVSTLFANGSGLDADKNVSAAPVVAWPTELIDTRILDGTELSVAGKADRLHLAPSVKLDDAGFAFAISNGTLQVTRLEGQLGSGNLAISGQMRAVDQSLRVEGAVEMSGVSLERIMVDGKGRGLAGGAANFESEFSASGRSVLSLVASLEGIGTFAVANPKVTRFDATALFDVGEIADGRAAFDAALLAGRSAASELEPVSGKFEAANGRLKFGPAKLAGEGLAGEVTSFIDVPSRRVDQELVLQRKGEAGIRISLVHAGLFGEVGRDVEISNVPDLGSVRWSEPLDDYALPPPDPVDEWVEIEPMAIGSTDDAGGEVGGNAAPDAHSPTVPKERELPPVGLIDQQVIDLPILEERNPVVIDDGAG